MNIAVPVDQSPPPKIDKVKVRLKEDKRKPH